MTTTELVRDTGARRSLPAVAGLNDPYETAYLQGGVAEVIRLAIFELVRRKILDATERQQLLHKVRRLRRTAGAGPTGAPPEAAVFRFISSERKAGEMFSADLRNEVAGLCERYRTALEARGYVRATGAHLSLVAALIMAAAGAAVFALSVAGPWPAVIVSAATAILIGWWAAALKVTGAGRRAISEAKKDCKGVDGAADGISSAAVALFGFSILEDSSYDALPLMFAKSHGAAGFSDSSDCGAGCGGGGCGN